MDPAIFDYLLIAVGVTSLSTFGFAVAWIRARERAVRAEGRAAERFSAGADARFDRLEQIVEGTALELERLGEAQRFQSKLLAERAGATASSARTPLPGRIVTPH
ncbi:MAG: hypothetical protein V4617_03170 [Gemmatimonadota bacterium]